MDMTDKEERYISKYSGIPIEVNENGDVIFRCGDKIKQKEFLSFLFGKISTKKHVMSYDELRNVTKGDTVYEEIKSKKSRLIELQFNGKCFTSNGVQQEYAEHYLYLFECTDPFNDYGVNFRVWNMKPTEEEMKNTPWENK